MTLLLVVVLLLGNAFFVGAEFALLAARRTVVEPLTATSARARAALRAMNDIPLMVAGAQLGITICSLGLGAIAEPALAHLLEPPFAALGLPDEAVHPVAFTLALGIIAYLHTVVGEMVPKNLTLAGPDAAVLWLGATTSRGRINRVGMGASRPGSPIASLTCTNPTTRPVTRLTIG